MRTKEPQNWWLNSGLCISVSGEQRPTYRNIPQIRSGASRKLGLRQGFKAAANIWVWVLGGRTKTSWILNSFFICETWQFSDVLIVLKSALFIFHLTSDVCGFVFRFPVVAMGVLKWVDWTVSEPRYFQLQTDHTPIHLALLDEVWPHCLVTFLGFCFFFIDAILTSKLPPHRSVRVTSCCTRRSSSCSLSCLRLSTPSWMLWSRCAAFSAPQFASQ